MVLWLYNNELLLLQDILYNFNFSNIIVQIIVFTVIKF